MSNRLDVQPKVSNRLDAQVINQLDAQVSNRLDAQVSNRLDTLAAGEHCAEEDGGAVQGDAGGR